MNIQLVLSNSARLVFAILLLACDGRSLIGAEEGDPVPDSGAEAGSLPDVTADANGGDRASIWEVDSGALTSPNLVADASPNMCTAGTYTCGSACCGENQVCVQDQCLSSCPLSSPNICRRRCTDFSVDPWNCGGCGQVCAQGLECAAGACRQVL